MEAVLEIQRGIQYSVACLLGEVVVVMEVVVVSTVAGIWVWTFITTTVLPTFLLLISFHHTG